VSPSGAGTQLLLLRHAHAGSPESWHGDDDARPLSDKGREQATRMGAFLASVGVRPDTIVSSPKVRARESADLVATELGVPVRLDNRLGGGLSIEALEDILADFGDPARPMLVGHDPDFSDLLATLVASSYLPMRKGALARVDLERPVRPGAGTLRWLVPPDLLPPADAG
jgi:phosphohistidine phosphatase